MSSASRPDLRWICLVLALLAALSFVNGLRAARERHEMLLPSRLQEILTLPHSETIPIDPAQSTSLLLALPEGHGQRRLVLHQIFPERRLLRWLEAPTAGGPYLYLPLRGLDPGEYWLGEIDRNATAGPEEMDRPVEELPVLLKFHLISAAEPANE